MNPFTLTAAEIGPRAALADEDVKRVAAEFGLTDARVERDLGGTYNLNLLIRSHAGRYVMRVYRPWVTPHRLECIQAIRVALHDAQLPVPTALPSVRGAGWIVYDGRLVEVERFIEHDPVVHTPDVYAVAFELLAVLHDAMRARALTRWVAPRIANYGTSRQLHAGITRTVDVLKGEPWSPERAAALGLCHEADDLVRRAALLDGLASRLPVQLVHGDYRLGNVVFRGATPAAILDFDFVDIHERVYDVAYAVYWALVGLDVDLGVDTRIWNEVELWLTRYDGASALPLTEDELRMLPWAMARVPLYWIAEAGFTPDSRRAVLAAAPGVARAWAILAHAQRLLRLSGM